ncbi:MAG TPA: 2-amino-4-hydroxy-6-hydroxymethyldihydropteridine diphosphokinase [Candidatus Lumbricidophila sp.]|nr:2-amino-4-hydroxy-6-hydroxymethyldihydropteridine diphosphokinase [Candidatus Lumbricidophila sp.]
MSSTSSTGGLVRAVIAFGANLGDREHTITESLRALAAADGIELVAISPLYESAALKPAGVDHSAPAYLNGVALVDTTLDAHALLERLAGIEAQFGRVRETHWGDRTIDLDLIDFGGQHIADAVLEVPHPRAWQRAFVLRPWLDVDPTAVIPGRGAVAQLAAEASDEVTRR